MGCSYALNFRRGLYQSKVNKKKAEPAKASRSPETDVVVFTSTISFLRPTMHRVVTDWQRNVSFAVAQMQG